MLQSDDDGMPRTLLTNIGLARTAGEGFIYGCPSEWDHDGDGEYDEVTPLAAATSELLVVAGDPDLYLSVDHGCSFAPVPASLEGLGPSTLALVAAGGRIWALINRGERRELVDVQSGELLFDDEGDLHAAIASEEGILLGGVDASTEPPTLRLVEVFTDARPPVERALPPPSASLDRVRLRKVELQGDAKTVWLSAAKTGGIELWKVTDDDVVREVFGPVPVLHGPVGVCGAQLVATGGSITVVDEGAASCGLEALEALTVRCLQEHAGSVYACHLFDLVRVDRDTGSVAPFFVFEELEGPDYSCLQEGERRDRCEASWVHFGAEAGLIDEPDPEPEPADPEPAPISCGQAPAPFASLFLLVLGLKRPAARPRPA